MEGQLSNKKLTKLLPQKLLRNHRFTLPDRKFSSSSQIRSYGVRWLSGLKKGEECDKRNKMVISFSMEANFICLRVLNRKGEKS